MTESPNTPPTRAAIYVRSASERSNPGSLVRQERRCREAIAKQLPGCVVVSVIRDAGVSGSAPSRPGLDALLKKVAEPPCPFDVVVVDTTSVVGRNLSLVQRVLDILQHHRVAIHVVDLNMEPAHL